MNPLPIAGYLAGGMAVSRASPRALCAVIQAVERPAERCSLTAVVPFGTLPWRRHEIAFNALLLIGVASAALFVIIVFVEGALRPGYDAMYHTVSELCLGERAWVQVTNFAQMGVGMVILAAGVNQALDSSIASILLGLMGLGLVGAAIFRPDPMRGYPPDAPRVVASEQSRHAKIHDVLGGPIFLALFLAVLLVAFDLEGGWRAYTFATAGVGLALTITTAISLQRDAPKTGLANRGVVLVYWSWIVLIGIHLSGTTPS